MSFVVYTYGYGGDPQGAVSLQAYGLGNETISGGVEL
jgi:hypothetical protein